MGKARQERWLEKRAAFEAVVAKHEAALLRYVARILRDADAAQDVVQDTFLKLFRRWNDVVKPGANLSTWLYRVAHNEAVDCIRKRQRRQALHFRQSEERRTLQTHAAPAPFGETSGREKVRQALDALDLRERQVVLLKVYEEKSYRDIADIAGLSVGNVGYILHHALKKMAAQLTNGKVSTGNEDHEKTETG